MADSGRVNRQRFILPPRSGSGGPAGVELGLEVFAVEVQLRRCVQDELLHCNVVVQTGRVNSCPVNLREQSV